MPNPLFPTLSGGTKPDAADFSVSYEDPALRTDMEGGYVVSRARHTRTPRKTFKVVYRNISNADKILIENFWNTVRGGSVIFDWVNPEDTLTYAVRFKDSLSSNYEGMGNTKRWDCSFSVEQA